MTERGRYICWHCNEREFGKDWSKGKKRVITKFTVGFNDQLLFYAVARHDWDKHEIDHGTPNEEGKKFMEEVKSDKYKDLEIGNVIE